MRRMTLIVTIAFLGGLSAGLILRSGHSLTAVMVARARQTAAQDAGKSHPAETSPAERGGIEQLHQEDVRATLSGDVHQLASLWDEDGVLMAPDAPTLIGRKEIETELQKDKDENPESKPVGYTPQVADLQVANGWAVEWGSFDAQTQDNSQKQPASFRGRFLRVLKKQADGSWKFSRVMWNLPAKSPGH
jgi:uncharacterized protein (TIGR02246 family)